MRLNEVIREFERFGAVKTVQDLVLRLLKLLFSARVLKGVTIAAVNPEFLKCDKPYHGAFLSEAQLIEITRNHPEYEMSESFLRESFAKGDECYGFLDGPVLAAYGWYSNRPTAIDAPGMEIHFDERYIYMYKALTQERYRGERLHSVAVTRALNEYLARGYRGLVSYIEWNNFSSLRSFYRTGYSDFGQIYLARIFGTYFTHASKGCKRYSFRLEHNARNDFTSRMRSPQPSTPIDRGR